MRLGGLQKNTALDFPGLLSAIVFTQGCNFTCPYCHNPELVKLFGEPVAEEAVLNFLHRRRSLLDGLVISGGEPCLQPNLDRFCAQVKGLGYAVKIDSNGSRPEVLADLISRKLVDYVALDVKADPHHYPESLSPQDPGPAIMESLNLLKRTGLPHEFRLTVCAPFINDDNIKTIGRAVAGPAPVFLQSLRQEKNLNPEFLRQYEQPGPKELSRYLNLLKQYAPNCAIR